MVSGSWPSWKSRALWSRCLDKCSLGKGAAGRHGERARRPSPGAHLPASPLLFDMDHWKRGSHETRRACSFASPFQHCFSPQAIPMHQFWNYQSVPDIFRGENNVITRSLVWHEVLFPLLRMSSIIRQCLHVSEERLLFYGGIQVRLF